MGAGRRLCISSQDLYKPSALHIGGQGHTMSCRNSPAALVQPRSPRENEFSSKQSRARRPSELEEESDTKCPSQRVP